MTAYNERDMRYDEATRKGYSEIMKIATASPYPHKGNGKQYVDFEIGSAGCEVPKVRVLVDFRGEYFSSFFLDTMLPIATTSPIRNIIHLSAQEAYDYIISKANQLNS